MRLTRVYVDGRLEPGSIVELPPASAQHLAKVLRARGGDELILFNGDGREFAGAIDSIRGSRVVASIGEGRPIDRESPLAVTLLQCVPRGDRMDFIVQKATELGIARIVPLLSQRSVVRLDERQAESKAAHWRAVAVNACEQCGRNRVPSIDAALPLISYLGSLEDGGIRLVLEPDLPAVASFGNLASVMALTPALQIAIGPEGGFAPDELEGFRIAGFTAMTLGPRILRTETAAIAAITWLQTRFGDMQALNT